MAERSARPAPLEWVAAAIGLAIFAALFWTIFAQTGDRHAAVPDLVIERRRMIATPGGTTVAFDVRNRSDRTAAAVVVEGRLLDGKAEVASSEVTIDYVPARSRVGAGLMFSESAQGRRVEIRAVGYRDP